MDKHTMGRHRRISRLPRTTLASRAALAAGALVPTIASVGSAHAATPQAAICTSDEPGLADKLSEDIDSALDGATATTAISLHDRTTNTTCTLDADRPFDSASTVKVTRGAPVRWAAH
ncbi:hypothetical protein [Streptomyces sp. NPDC059455]|uniref:hypothetical protein n=1 Tax=Streptomyces sp. NPDC059455 TaxID=3346837 RepID=UPI0036A0B75C